MTSSTVQGLKFPQLTAYLAYLPAAPLADGIIGPAQAEDSNTEFVELLHTACTCLFVADIDSACTTCPEFTKLQA